MLLSLSQLGNNESQDEHPDDDSHHTDGQWQTQLAVDGVLTEFTTVTQVTFAHQVRAASFWGLTGAVAVTLSLPTGWQAIVDASCMYRYGSFHCRRGYTLKHNKSINKKKKKKSTGKCLKVEQEQRVVFFNFI